MCKVKHSDYNALCIYIDTLVIMRSYYFTDPCLNHCRVISLQNYPNAKFQVPALSHKDILQLSMKQSKEWINTVKFPNLPLISIPKPAEPFFSEVF